MPNLTAWRRPSLHTEEAPQPVNRKALHAERDQIRAKLSTDIVTTETKLPPLREAEAAARQAYDEARYKVSEVEADVRNLRSRGDSAINAIDIKLRNTQPSSIREFREWAREKMEKDHHLTPIAGAAIQELAELELSGDDEAIGARLYELQAGIEAAS